MGPWTAVAIAVAAAARWVSRDTSGALSEGEAVAACSGARHRTAALLVATLCLSFAGALAFTAASHLRDGALGFYVVDAMLVVGGVLLMNEARGVTVTLVADVLVVKSPWKVGVRAMELAQVRHVRTSLGARAVRFYDASGRIVAVPTMLRGSDALLRQLRKRLAQLRPDVDTREISCRD